MFLSWSMSKWIIPQTWNCVLLMSADGDDVIPLLLYLDPAELWESFSSDMVMCCLISSCLIFRHNYEMKAAAMNQSLLFAFWFLYSTFSLLGGEHLFFSLCLESLANVTTVCAFSLLVLLVWLSIVLRNCTLVSKCYATLYFYSMTYM